MSGTLFIVSAPSGAGKTTLTHGLLAAQPDLAFSVSTTTRSRRPDERDGVDYHFVERAEFDRLVAKHAFLEHAFVHGNGYGTERASVEAALARGTDLLLDIDVQGAAQIRDFLKQSSRSEQSIRCFSIFIMPPSLQALEARLRARHTNTEEDIQVRLKRAGEEMSRASEYDATIVNDDAATATLRLVEIVRSQRSGKK